MLIAGVDYSSRFVDIVTVPYDGTGQPVWTRYPLTGTDAFDRARSVADSLPGRHSAIWDDCLAVGIEDPRGYNAGALYRVQGAVLARIPARMLVQRFSPNEWRKLAGLAGNASKFDVAQESSERWATSGRTFGFLDVPQDAHDAHLIALATRSLITQEKAA